DSDDVVIQHANECAVRGGCGLIQPQPRGSLGRLTETNATGDIKPEPGSGDADANVVRALHETHDFVLSRIPAIRYAQPTRGPPTGRTVVDVEPRESIRRIKREPRGG